MLIKKILIVSDAWYPQVNGVVRTYDNTIRELKASGFNVQLIEPGQFKNIPAPLYPEIHLAITKPSTVRRMLLDANSDYIHIATEGPLGLMARHAALKEGLSFSTAFHTNFPEYLKKYMYIPTRSSWRTVRWFHSAGRSLMAPSSFIIKELEQRGFHNVRHWGRGIDTTCFSPSSRSPKPAEKTILYVGRVAIEKNIKAFLELNVKAKKVVVGDGPIRKKLEQEYPDVTFAGYKTGEELAHYYRSAQALVFPSKTDTFGNVVLEALACGTAVAAYPLAGALELLQDVRLGTTHQDLEVATEMALLHADYQYCSEFASTFTWKRATQQFVSGLVEKGSGAAYTWNQAALSGAPGTFSKEEMSKS